MGTWAAGSFGNLPGDYIEVEHNLSSPVAAMQEQPMPGDLKPLAINSLNAILTSSELKELWEDDQE
jgi:uncharacterized protein DUF4259